MQVGETEPFIAELLGDLTATIQDLETHQIHMFYEAVGLMISADSDAKRREQYLVRRRPPAALDRLPSALFNCHGGGKTGAGKHCSKHRLRRH